MEYFTRGEFGKLRGVDLNSLRYYEKLGLLRPAYADPNTKYHYYTSEQLAELDTIQLCISVGIPLSRLKEYVDGSGNLQHRRLLEDGRKQMEEKVQELRNAINRVEYSLQYMDDDVKYRDRPGLYTRKIRERYIYTKEYDGKNEDARRIEMLAAELYAEAQEKGLSPIPPMGQIFQSVNGTHRHELFFEVTSRPVPEDGSVVRVPETECLCRQVRLSPDTDLIALIKDSFAWEPNMTIVVSNMIFDKFCFGSRPCELQAVTQEPETRSEG